MTERIGYRVIGTILSIKGECTAGHKVGQQLELSCHNTGNMCGFLYHDIFPYIVMLQFGGGFPQDWGGPDIVTVDCMDKWNTLTIELKRVNE